MKINIFTLGLVLWGIASPAFSDTYLLQSDYVGMGGSVGQRCSSGGKVLIKCNCSSTGNGVNTTCVENGDMPQEGCKLEDWGASSYHLFCVDATEETVCHFCMCNNQDSASYTSGWGNPVNNRVSRTRYTQEAKNFVCSVSTATEYGCAANYYTTASSPSASMTCSACPSSGKSAIGNTAITGCYIQANTDLTDTSGTYKYTSNCYYSK